jgi:hypothetical protein
LGADKQNNVYCTCFEGRFNIRENGKWGKTQFLPNVLGAEIIGFVETAPHENSVYVIWEECSGDNDLGLRVNSAIYVAELTSEGNLQAIKK